MVETRFMADAMLGRLSSGSESWVMILIIRCLMKKTVESLEEGRIFLSRRARISEAVPGAVWCAHHVGEQLRKLAEEVF
jgi:hypothetical protein